MTTTDAKDRKKDITAGIPPHELNLWGAFMSFMEIHQEGTGIRDPETINPDDFDRYRFSD